MGLFEWLRDKALVSHINVTPTRGSLAAHFGPASLSYQRDIAALKSLYSECAAYETIRIKRRLWHDLLRTALGEIAGSPDELDDLFVRHTYLSAVVAMVVQATFGIDIYQKAETDPADLLHGRQFHSDTGLQGVVESDFFTWPTEVGGLPFLRTLGRRVDRFDWPEAPPDVAAILYETVIPPEERRQLGEYYTPDWLARTMVRELVTEPLEQHVLDPACGSGTFIAEAVAHFFEAAKQSGGLHPKQVLDRMRAAVTGIDVHPVAVHLARSAWALAAKPAILAVKESGYDASGTVPVYLGDSLQLRFNPGDMFAAHEVRIAVEDEQNTELVFPAALVEQADNFDALMGDASEYIEHGEDPFVALDDHQINDPQERQTLTETLKKLQELHTQGRDHIWAYYSRNLVRPVTLARRKVDVIIGNPPWINYNQTADALRTALERQSKELYGIWAGGTVRHPSGRGGLVLHPVRRPVPEGRRNHRHGDATQRPAGRPILQVAQRPVASPPRRQRPDRRLQLQDGLGPGAPAAQHLLPGAGLGCLCQAGWRGYCGPSAGRDRGSMGGQGRGRRRARVAAAITDTGVVGRFSLCRLFPTGSDHRSPLLVLRQRG